MAVSPRGRSHSRYDADVTIAAFAWHDDWAWSLPLIVLTMVIHVLGPRAHQRRRGPRSEFTLRDRRHFTALFVGGAQRHEAVRANRRIPVRHDPEGLAGSAAKVGTGNIECPTYIRSMFLIHAFEGRNREVRSALASSGKHARRETFGQDWTQNCGGQHQHQNGVEHPLVDLDVDPPGRTCRRRRVPPRALRRLAAR